MTIAEQLRQQGLEKGKYSIVLALMNNLKDKVQVAKLSNLSVAEVDKILKHFNEQTH